MATTSLPPAYSPNYTPSYGSGLRSPTPTSSTALRPSTTTASTTTAPRPTTPTTGGVRSDARPTTSFPTPAEQYQEKLAHDARLREAEQQKKQAAMDALAVEQARMANQAQQLSLAKAHQLSSVGNNPLSTTGVTMNVSNGGGAGGGSLGDLEGFLNRMRPGAVPREPAPSLPPAPTLPGREAPGGAAAGGLSVASEAAGIPAIPSGPSAAFSRAKDVAGRQGNKALDALKDVMSARGMGYSGQEGELGANILGDVSRHLVDVEYKDTAAREQRAYDTAMEAYRGALTQRGQDINFLTGTRGQDLDYTSNIYGTGVTQRGQDIDANTQWMSMLPQIYSMMARRSY